MSTKLLALVVFTYYMSAAHDLSFAAAGKFICLAVLSAIAISLGGGSVSIATSVMDIGYSLLELVAYLAIAEMASRFPTSSMRVLSCFYLIAHTSYLLGSSLGFIANSGILSDAAARFTEVLILIALAVATIYCFDEKKMMALVSKPQAEDAPLNVIGRDSFPSACFDSFGLTEREQEIAMLYAKGRSAVFIAEELQISPHTVRSHMARIYNKCAVHSRQELLSLIEDNQ